MNTATRKLVTRALGAVPAFVRAHDAAQDVRRYAREAASDAAYSTRRVVRHTKQAAEDRVDDARHVIRRNPLRSMGLAALARSLAGAFAALVMQRGRRASRPR